MKNFRSGVLEDCVTNQFRVGVLPPLVRSGLVYLVTPNDVQEMRIALFKGRLPPDFEAKLCKLAEGSLVERYVEHYCRLFFWAAAGRRGELFPQSYRVRPRAPLAGVGLRAQGR